MNETANNFIISNDSYGYTATDLEGNVVLRYNDPYSRLEIYKKFIDTKEKHIEMLKFIDFTNSGNYDVELVFIEEEKQVDNEVENYIL